MQGLSLRKIHKAYKEINFLVVNMLVLINGPLWFRGIDATFEIIYALITLFIALMSYKIYKITDDQQFKNLAMGFGLFSIAFFILAVPIFLISQGLIGTAILSVFDMPFFLHMCFSLLALTLLLVVTLRIKSNKVRLLILGLVGLLMLFSYQYYLKFHMISLLLLFFLTLQFFRNAQEKKTLNSKLVFISFYLLMFSQIFFITTASPLLAFVSSYALGHMVQLLGFLFLFYVLARILKHGRKKRKA